MGVFSRMWGQNPLDGLTPNFSWW